MSTLPKYRHLFAILLLTLTSTTLQALTSLTVTSSISSEAGSLEDILTQAKTIDDEISITFNVTNSNISVTQGLDVYQDYDRSITIDGSTSTTPIQLSEPSGVFNLPYLLFVFTPNVTIKNIEFNRASYGVQVSGGANDCLIENCTINNTRQRVISQNWFI